VSMGGKTTDDIELTFTNAHGERFKFVGQPCWIVPTRFASPAENSQMARAGRYVENNSHCCRMDTIMFGCVGGDGSTRSLHRRWCAVRSVAWTVWRAGVGKGQLVESGDVNFDVVRGGL